MSKSLGICVDAASQDNASPGLGSIKKDDPCEQDVSSIQKAIPITALKTAPVLCEHSMSNFAPLPF